MKKYIKEKGITLVALVITVIILLILTGVTLNITLGDNGLFKQVKSAVEKYKEAEEKENSSISNLEEMLSKINSKTDEEGKIEVNKPKLGESGMIPIKYDEEKEKWVITNENDKEWYDYSEGTMKWANVMLSDGKYKTSEKNDKTKAGHYTDNGSTVVEDNEDMHIV